MRLLIFIVCMSTFSFTSLVSNDLNINRPIILKLTGGDGFNYGLGGANIAISLTPEYDIAFGVVANNSYTYYYSHNRTVKALSLRFFMNANKIIWIHKGYIMS